MAKTSLGLDSNLSAFLCHVLGWISGLILILIEKNDAKAYQDEKFMLPIIGEMTEEW
tara:strand:- start:312 stop:482 length:171 start_codon:yes stop_codon:yes gene_type:complete